MGKLLFEDMFNLALNFRRNQRENFIKMKSNITAKVKTNINASLASVWDALTKPEIIKQYFFGTRTTTSWEKGSPIAFDGEWEGKAYHDKGTVLDFQKYKLIKY